MNQWNSFLEHVSTWHKYWEWLKDFGEVENVRYLVGIYIALNRTKFLVETTKRNKNLEA